MYELESVLQKYYVENKNGNYILLRYSINTTKQQTREFEKILTIVVQALTNFRDSFFWTAKIYCECRQIYC
jgi:septation ring formation regulator EzrA